MATLVGRIKVLNICILQKQLKQLSHVHRHKSSLLFRHSVSEGGGWSGSIGPSCVGVRWKSSETDRKGSGSDPEQAEKSFRVFVKKLSRQAKMVDLKTLFPHAVKIEMPMKTEKLNFCIAVLHFRTEKEMEDLIKSQDSYVVNNKQLVFDYYGSEKSNKANRKLYFDNLSIDANEHMLKEIFPEATEIVIRIAADGKPEGWGYMEFATEDEARSALRLHQGVLIGLKRLKIKWWGKHKPEESDEQVELFVREDVQELLLSITGFDHKKLFKHRTVSSARVPEYKLLTEEELAEFEQKTIRAGKRKLRMPPYLKETPDEVLILSKDPEMEGFSENKFIFTDISTNKDHHDRLVVVRETDGTLRMANREERFRMLHIFYPSHHVFVNKPRIFEEENMKSMWSRRMYVNLLERACVQFEPDMSEFIRVCQRTYENVNDTKNFDDLRSTRFFGPMAFHLTLTKNIGSLLTDMLERELIDDATQLVRLYHIVHPQCKSAQENAESPGKECAQFIREFAQNEIEEPQIVLSALSRCISSSQTKQEAVS